MNFPLSIAGVAADTSNFSQPNVRQQATDLNRNSAAFVPESSDNRQASAQTNTGFERFNRVLEQGFKQNFASNQVNTANIPGLTRVEPISSEQASANILGFIEQSLRRDAANGASEAQLQENLSEALKGFEKGFAEARDIIESAGLLTPELAEDINDTYVRVTKGIEDIRAQLTGATGNTTEINNTTRVSRSQLAASSSVSESFSLDLVTQDGDRVSIDIQRAASSRFAAASVQGNNASASAVSFESSSSSRFQLTVEGELDDDERAAIDQLLENVDAIATDFYAGNLDEAFASALTLDIDREELSSLSLELQKTTVSTAFAAYQSNSPVSTSLPFQELEQLLGQIEAATEAARQFAEPLQVLRDVTEGLARLRESQSDLGPVASDANTGQAERAQIGDISEIISNNSLARDPAVLANLVSGVGQEYSR